MTNQEVLHKAVQIAIENGWYAEIDGDRVAFDDEARGYYYCVYIADMAMYGLIYNHKFAKALWGEEYLLPGDECPEWKTRLQQMVVSPDPIDYLRNYLTSIPSML